MTNWKKNICNSYHSQGLNFPNKEFLQTSKQRSKDSLEKMVKGNEQTSQKENTSDS